LQRKRRTKTRIAVCKRELQRRAKARNDVIWRFIVQSAVICGKQVNMLLKVVTFVPSVLPGWGIIKKLI
jgi:hypothetical protein